MSAQMRMLCIMIVIVLLISQDSMKIYLKKGYIYNDDLYYHITRAIYTVPSTSFWLR